MRGTLLRRADHRRWGRRMVLTIATLTITPIVVPASPGVSAGTPPDTGCVATDGTNVDIAHALTLPDGPSCVSDANERGGQLVTWWTVGPDEAAQRWTLSASRVPGQAVTIAVHQVEVDSDDLVTSDETSASASTTDGPAAISDVMLAPGRYLVGVATSGPGAYELHVAPGAPVPDHTEVEPNDTSDQATPEAGPFGVVGDHGDSADVYAWDLDDAAAATSWELVAQAPLSAALDVRLSDAQGTDLFQGASSPEGVLDVPDLGLDPGRYFITIAPGSGGPAPYVLELRPGQPREGGAEAEPNDDSASATPIDLDVGSTTVTGRLATTTADSDIDTFSIAVDSRIAGRQIDVKLFWRDGAERDLCLVDAAGQSLQCAGGTGSAAFNDVVLGSGDYTITVRGDPDLDDAYLLRFDVTEEATSGFEAEPDDTRALASPFAVDGDGFRGVGRLIGHGAAPDDDTFSFTVGGEPQLWELTATGDGVDRLDSLDVLGSSEVSGSAVDGSFVITDLFLLPGEHAVSVSGLTGDYTLAATPLGPPDPHGEHEPNNSAERSQAIRLDETRVGRLPVSDDVDYYRFSLRNDTHVVIDVETPDTAQIAMTLSRGGESIGRTGSPDVGQPLVYDGVLPPGDYSMTLAPVVPSDERYSVTVSPADPYIVPDDAEPNNEPEYARPIAADGIATGTIDPGDAYGDVDWYSLPAQVNAGSVAIEIDDDLATLELDTAATPNQPASPLPLVPGVDAGSYTVDVPAGVPLLLAVSGGGDYRLAVAPVGGRPADVAPVDLDSDLTLSWDGCDIPVAAYWPDAQRVECTLQLANGASTDIDATLVATTGDYAWTVELADDHLSVVAGETAEVAAEITVAPDAWAENAVIIAARAVAGDAMATATTTVVPDRNTEPADPEPADPVAAALLGGLDVAWSGLGATVVTDDPSAADEEDLLHDALTPLGGWSGDTGALPIELTVELAGDDPVPVAGFTIDPQASNGGGSDQARAFDLELSLDGQTWEPVLSGTLLAVPAEQSFPLREPVDARFARLRVRSVQDSASPNVVLGEWTVVASPDWVPPDGFPGVTPSGGLDIGSPDRGGHIVSVEPGFGVPTDYLSLLVADGSQQASRAMPGQQIDVVLGFHHDRAAQVDSLTWTDPPASDPATRLASLAVSVSVGGPAGPWIPIGPWVLDRSAGSVPSFTFPDGTWARFVRLTGAAPQTDAGAEGTTSTPPEDVTWELPDAIGVTEHPIDSIDDGYRSILGSWGIGRQTGQYERDVVTPVVALDPDAGDDVEHATPLAFDHEVHDTAWVGRDEDWYHVAVPDGQSAIAFTAGGTSSVDVEMALFDADGRSVDLVARPAGDGIGTRFEALVEPGREYDLQVTEPPTSVVFAFDTSLSIGPYSTAVYQGVARYAGDVEQGQESVNILPFGADMLLDDWSDEPYLIQAAVNDYPQSATSSDAEGALLTSMDHLGERPGARAIVLITDAQTNPSTEQLDDLWPAFTSTRPRVYAVQVAGGMQLDQDLMEDWSSVNDGIYTYVTDQGGMDVAFDRAATTLRRASYYSLSVGVAEPPPPPPTTSTTSTTTSTTTTSTTLPAAPGLLEVLAVAPQPGAATAVAPGSADVALILDTSGSMLAQMPGGGRRIDVARAALTDLVTQTLPAGIGLSLRTFGDTPQSCDTRLVVPRSALDPAAMADVVADVPVVDEVRTPIGASLAQVGNDLAGVTGPGIVVLVTDGEETCGGDPAGAIQALVASGIDVHVNIVGFALDDENLKAQFQDWARLGNGQYIDAADQAQLTAAITAAVQPTFDVADVNGSVVATGQAGGTPVSLPPGLYTVEVHAAVERQLPATVVSATTSQLQP